MKTFYFLIWLMLSLNMQAQAKDEPLRVVTTTKTFASLVQAVGGEHVKVDYVAPPTQNVHFIQPRPSDVLRLSKADLFVHAGLDLELWRYPLAEASGKIAFLPGGERELDLAGKISLLEVPQGVLSRAQGDIHIYGNPHYWLDPRNGGIMAAAICDKLSELRPEQAEVFKRNRDQFLTELEQKMKGWRDKIAPFKGAPILAYHNSWPYLAEFAGLEIAGFVEPKPGIPPTPKHLTGLLSLIREKNVRVVIKEPYFENRSPKKLSKETGIQVITLAQGVGEIKEATDFFTLFDVDIDRLASALQNAAVGA